MIPQLPLARGIRAEIIHSSQTGDFPPMNRFERTVAALLATASMSLVPSFAAQDRDQDDQAGHRIKHVLLISVDGLHAIDLTNYIGTHPDSTLAELARHGVRYDNASTSTPSDSFPGLAALVTGGSPTTTGFWYDVTYNRKLSPPAQTTPYGIAGSPSACPSVQGTQIGFDEEIDSNYLKLDGGGGINPKFLPRNPAFGCAPVYPHSYLRVNTIFEVAREAGRYTAWSDKHPSYEWVKGPSGQGLNDFYAPEINSIPVSLPGVAGCDPLPDPANATPNNAWTDSIQNIRCYDQLKVNAILNQIDGKTHDGKTPAMVPAIFGMNFQAVSVGQKLAGNGYFDVSGAPSVGLASEFDFVDQSLGAMVTELKKKGLWGSTVIIVTAKHGQSPIDIQKVTKIPGSTPANIIGSAYAFDISDDGSLIWLKDPSLITDVLPVLSTPSSQQALGVQEIFAGETLRTRWNNPGADERTPDIILKTNTGVIFTGGSKIAEHGGLNEDDYHTALLVSGSDIEHKVVKTAVLNQQVAPSILKLLGLDPWKLQAVQKEGISVLPFLPY
jgi:Type I phosphodiesterase / nucleotide pyrophosphatase